MDSLVCARAVWATSQEGLSVVLPEIVLPSLSHSKPVRRVVENPEPLTTSSPCNHDLIFGILADGTGSLIKSPDFGLKRAPSLGLCSLLLLRQDPRFGSWARASCLPFVSAGIPS